ncbi:hypothetical protein [Mucilaginibacter sp. BT774]|uniref:hypothetical protein n=1 Tax=Mucilaginibacter sp. BT774 TaxID=3062276 RepID=UPI00267458C1|nr:hypothetical protein [Mucilaginibacter sp. BT774]MDO3626630.1 hypothetical protein [Mucilaginibacter sp. BT774]
MDEIKADVHGARMINKYGAHQLVLMALNEQWAGILLHTLGKAVRLKYQYDGSDITFYFLFELPDINKMFSVPVNATTETRKWLSLIDGNEVTAIRVGYRDGKGGLLLYGEQVLVIL